MRASYKIILVLAAALLLIPAMLFDFHIISDDADYYEETGHTNLVLTGICATFILEEKHTNCFYYARAAGDDFR